ncbi:MAG TPA: PAS domain S-box protein, partial [Opitutus sp.]|nr:PAS domain S-box protein [Opitutus sp.]
MSSAIINSSNDAIITVTLESTIATWNPAAERLLGYRAAEIVGRSLLTLVPSEHEPEARLSLERLTQGKLTGPYETLHRHKDGRLIPVAVTTSALVDPRGALLGGMGIVRDISERKQLEAEVLRVSDREQQRIGHELHDNVGQQLTAIELMLHQLIGMRTDPPVRDLQIERIAQHVRTAMRDVRGLARGLTPHLLDANELPTALAGLLELTAGAVAHRLSCPHPISGIGNDTATHLYRIAQEAINNALKHSGATLIEVRLQQDAGALHLTIADNGRGFDTRESDARGVGLHIMQYRATLIGGRLTFDSRPGRGLTVQCVLPLAS